MNCSRLWRSSVAVLAVAGLAVAALTACGGTASPHAAWHAGQPAPSAWVSEAAPAAAGKPVRIRLLEGDGSTWGVGMPVVAYLSARITDARAFAAATTVTVDGAPAQGAWYFERSAIYRGYPLEAHYRTRDYWPAHARIHVGLPVQGRSAGPGLVFANSLTLDMSIGAAHVSRIDGHTERMVVTSDGAQMFSFPVSLGKAGTPTFAGVKVVMEKDRVQRMTGPGYDLKVPWSVRITNSGEFVHSASWNGGNIGQRSTSHGCTNLNVADAQRFYAFAQVGDVTVYTHTGGPTTPGWDGYGDWNVPWSTWQGGGAVRAA